MLPDANSPGTARHAALSRGRLAVPRIDVAVAVPADPGTGPSATWQALIDAMMHAVWLVDPRELRIVGANRAAAALAGISVDGLVGKGVLELAVSPEDVFFWGEVANGVAEHIDSETLVMRAGVAVPVLRRVSLIEAASARGGNLFVVALHDRSDEVRVRRELERSAADLCATLESTHDGLLVTDLNGGIRNFNQRFAAIWELPLELLQRRDDDAVLEWMRRAVHDAPACMHRLAAIDEAASAHATDTLHLKSGRLVERVTRPQLARGVSIGHVVSFRDITEEVAAQRRIEALVHTDALTGLSNRRLLTERVEQSLQIAQRDGKPFALLVVNLDHFSRVNESLGHSLGDRVLMDVAKRIKACVRQVDTVARLDGDEFVVLAYQADAAGAEMTGTRLIDALKRPFRRGGMSFSLTASIGISLCPGDGASMDELMRRADAAMRTVKMAGRAAFRFHRPRTAQAEAQCRQLMHLDHAMRQGLERGEFRLLYQPQISLASGSLVGAEALLRWRNPAHGEVSPVEFIPVAEASGFILRIDQWVMKRAVRQAARWLHAGRPLTVSINISGLQFQQPRFVDDLADLLSEASLPAELIELELTESILIQDAQEAMLRLHALAQLGVRLAIDDFGMGYSSLSYLKRFPIRRLKIDRSFVQGLPDEPSDVGIARAIVNLAQALRLEVVAEGVETEVQREFLQRLGCDHYQGHLCAPALSPEAFATRFA